METNAEKNKKVVRDFYEEVFRKHDLAAVDRFMHDDYIQHNPDVRQGKAGFVDFHKGFFAAIPDHCEWFLLDHLAHPSEGATVFGCLAQSIHACVYQ